jgi:peptidoglycan/LPS O-acetylase OafA/YrhL
MTKREDAWGPAASLGAARFIGGIDGLRAFAVISVLLYHLEPRWLPGGFVGVDVFFVISGFVVAHSVYGSNQARFTKYFMWFYRRRLIRIMPALLAFVLIIGLANMLLLPASPATKLIDATGISAIVGASNFLLLWREGGYFSPATEFNPFTHTWSLAVEEQYYLLFPFLSYFLIVHRFDRPVANKVAISLTWLLCVASLVAAWLLTIQWRDFAFYMMPTRFWELGIGLLLRVHLQDWSERAHLNGGSTMLSIVSVAAIVALTAGFWITPADVFPFPGALLPCAATAMLIVTVWLFRGSLADRFLSSVSLRFLGKISYSLYLWHWGVIVIMRWTTGLETLLLKIVGLVLTFALAVASYYLIEQRFRQSALVQSATTKRFFTGFAAFGALSGLTAIALILLRPVAGLSATNDRAIWDPYFVPRSAAANCAVERQTASMMGGNKIVFTPSCQKLNAPRVFIVGDSHAGSYARMALHLAAEAHTRVTILTRGGCPLLDGAHIEPRPECDGFRAAALDSMLHNSRRGDILLVTGLYTPRYRDEWGEPDPGPGPGSPVTPQLGATRAIYALAPYRTLGLRIILEAPKPTLPTAIFRCADAYTRINPYCNQKIDVPAAEQQLRRSKAKYMLELTAAAIPGAKIWDPFPVLCPGTICRGYRGENPLYFDTDHLTGHANTLLLPSLIKIIKVTPRELGGVIEDFTAENAS